MSVLAWNSIETEADSARAPRTSAVERVRVLKVTQAGGESAPDCVVVEEPLTVHLRSRGVEVALGSTMRTPGHDLDLAIGLAVAEGVVRNLRDIAEVRQCRPGGHGSTNDVIIELGDHVIVDVTRLARVSHPSSACGMCGRDEIDSLMSRVPVSSAGVSIDGSTLAGLPDVMSGSQSVFRRTGGLHAAALANTNGEVLIVREDVGRHNAVDKVVGRALLDDVRADVLVVSGRAGFEIVQKAAMAGVSIIASVSAPTSLSVEAAKEAGLTLAAFVRGGTMTVYCGEQRINGLNGVAAW